jgi:3-methyladenine DNA glycosylase AlkD
MRNLFEYIGIKTPLRNELMKLHFAEFGKPERSKLHDYVRFLWNLPEREFVYAAFSLLETKRSKLEESDLQIIEFMIENKQWWDSVDTCVRFSGPYFRKFPHLIADITGKWANSENFWFRRSALLFQLNYGKNTDFELLTKYINLMSDSNEFFIQKAIGWALRQYSKHCPEIVMNFVERNKLKPLSKREALKIINKTKK